MNEMEALESTYWDKCDVWRDVETVVNNRDSFVPQQLYSSIKCALSKPANTTRLNTNQTEEQNQIDYTFILFLSPSYDLKTGDEIRVTTSMNQQFELIAGEPFKYPSHQVVTVHRKDEA
ncbi:ABC transporter ATP-binding protein [Bacillus sp. AFS017336]|uniref:ABC transporter ATP-binding protein n=1 Tax=Bacillus sp. AFS017336 TaxID=2033489 RepID=UPI000BF2096D|nr:ABC transporter ATP-binding protein [Bacillus sp. AFS017336]PEL12671.1 ABC transporter ATP-binding protein [Bacillus sp. AFS017336]